MHVLRAQGVLLSLRQDHCAGLYRPAEAIRVTRLGSEIPQGGDQHNRDIIRSATHRTQTSNDVRYKYSFNLFKPTGHVMHQQFNIQQLYVLPTLYLCVLYLSENKQRHVPLTA